MNKIKQTVLLLACVLAMALLTSCGGLDGRYTDYRGDSLVLDGDRMTMDVGGMPVEGNYEIKGDKLIWWPEIDDYGLFLLGLPADYDTETTYTYEKIGNTIRLGGREFKK